MPIGIYSAVRRYSIGDHAFSLIGYLGLAIAELPAGAGAHVHRPAMVRAERRRPVLAAICRGAPGAGTSSSTCWRTCGFRWSCWVPSGTANLIRSMRAAVLDELDKMYVVAAKAPRACRRCSLLLKYPVRMALEPDRLDARLAADLS
jgi:peptide/nickel transport system permease protein